MKNDVCRICSLIHSPFSPLSPPFSESGAMRRVHSGPEVLADAGTPSLPPVVLSLLRRGGDDHFFTLKALWKRCL